MKKQFYSLYISIILLFGSLASLNAVEKFNLVLDAGHGGHDAGAVGRISREKDINLGVVKHLGSLIEDNFKDVNVVYTRKTDVFIPLQERADIANRNKSNLFISVHTNAAKSKAAYGAEVYTLGLAKTKANLDVAMTENSVILLEDDYKTKYKGFDPNSVESYIMFEFMQDKYLDQSLSFASNVQNNFIRSVKRYDRGVRQAGFWVLHRTASPSVLVELGFISHTEEEKFLASESGQRKMATAIYNAFINYKKDYDKMMGYHNSAAHPKEIAIVENDSPKEEIVKDQKNVDTQLKTEHSNTEIAVKPKVESGSESPLFKVQFYASPTKLNASNKVFKGIDGFDSYQEGGMYKYTLGAESDYDKILEIKKTISKKFPDAFVIAFIGDKKMSVKEAINWKR